MSIFGTNNDVFRTQADNRFNAFADPMNAVNQNPGDWGINPAYMTPAYLSPFRPQYQGDFNQLRNSGYRPGWGESANQIFNPFARPDNNYGGNYNQQTNPYYDTIFAKPMDKSASFMQNWVAPAAVSWGAYKYLGRSSAALGRHSMRGMVGGMMAGGGFGYRATSAGIRMAGGVGAVAGGLLLPALAAQAGVDGLDSAVFDPYIAQRNMGRSLRDNFQGITFGDGSGDLYSGGGLNRGRAQKIAREVSQSTARDNTFTQNEGALLMDYAARTGMMDNVMPDQMAERMKKLMKQTKVMMSVINSSDFQETMELMAKLQMAGASDLNANALAGKLSAIAGAGGLQVKKLLETTGAQGQLMFGAGGLTPYVGQVAGFHSATSMAAAYRSGLISPAMMARMGGQEGAAQSALAAQVAAYKTPFAGIMASNAYFGRGETGSVVDNIAQFGGRMVGNPLQNIGRHLMSENALVSRMAEDRDDFGIQSQILQIAQAAAPQSVKENGNIDMGTAYMVMTQQMGMSPDAAKAQLLKFASMRDPKTAKQMMAGSERASIEMLMKYQQQEGLNKGIFTTPYNFVKRGFMRVQEAGAHVGGTVQENVGDMGDRLKAWADKAIFHIDPEEARTGEFNEVDGMRIMQADLSRTPEALAKRLRDGTTGRAGNSELLMTKNYGVQAGGFTQDLDTINKLAKDKRNEHAIRFLSSSSTSLEKRSALASLAKENLISKDYIKNSDKAKGLTEFLSDLGVKDSPDGDSNQEILLKNIKSILPEKTDINDKLDYTNTLHKAYATLTGTKGEKISPEMREKIARLTGKSVDDLDDQTIRNLAEENIKQIGEKRLSHLVGISDVDGETGLISELKNRHLPALSAKVETANDDVGASAAQQEAQRASIEYRSKIKRMAMEGKIDTGEAMNAINALDNKETVGKFSNAVDMFADAVNRMPFSRNPTSTTNNDPAFSTRQGRQTARPVTLN